MITISIIIPFIAGAIFLQSTCVSSLTDKKLKALGKAGQAADEIINNIKIVKSYCTEDTEAKRYGWFDHLNTLFSPTKLFTRKASEYFKRINFLNAAVSSREYQNLSFSSYSIAEQWYLFFDHYPPIAFV